MAGLYLEFFELAKKLRIGEDKLEEWIGNKILEAEAKEERDKDRELRRLEIEERRRLEEKEERDKDRELKRLEIEALKVKREMCDGNRPLNKPKIPLFNPIAQDIDLYLENFERQALLAQWPRDEWPSILFNLLQGDALQVLLSLSCKDLRNYDIVRDSLLRHFQCTCDEFSKKFRSAIPLENENFDSFVNRLKRYLDRWMNLSHVQDFNDLVFLIMKEQIYNSCSIELSVYLKDRRPCDLDSMKEMALTFSEARPTSSIARRVTSTEIFSMAAADSHPTRNHGTNRDGDVNNHSSVTCYRCGNQGHVMRDCRVPEHKLRKQNLRNNHGNEVDEAFGRTSSQQEHYYQPNSRPFYATNVAAAHSFDKDEKRINTDNKVQYTLVAEPIAKDGKIRLTDATVNGQPCKLLRDTGSSIAGCRESLVDPNKYTGREVSCITFGGNMEVYPTAYIYICSEYFNGWAEVAVLPSPIADIILGNITNSEKDIDHAIRSTQTACQVVTRGQTQTTLTQLKTSTEPIVAPLLNNIGTLQSRDKSLKGWLQRADFPPVGNISFILENGVLFRYYSGRNYVTKTLVVPETLRNRVMRAAHDHRLSGHFGVLKTVKCIQSEFSWPGLYKDVKEFIRSCHACQEKRPIYRDTNRKRWGAKTVDVTTYLEDSRHK